MPVGISCRTPAGEPWEAYLRARAGQILRALALARAELSLSLVGDVEMRALNRGYRGRDRPTDVLAFAIDEDGSVGAPRAVRRGVGSPSAARGGRPRHPPMPRLLGDVVISIDTAAAQARADRRSLAARLDALLIHGVLHLIGYDHEISPVEARRMAARARAVHGALARAPRPAALPGRARRPAHTRGTP